MFPQVLSVATFVMALPIVLAISSFWFGLAVVTLRSFLGAT